MHRAHSPRRRGFTLTEVMVASAIGAMIGLGAMSLTIYGGRSGRAIRSQQSLAQQAQIAVEGLHRVVRPATLPLRILNDAQETAAWGPRVELAWGDEPLGLRTLTLEQDGDPGDPWTSRLVYDPDTTQAGDEQVLARGVSSLEPAGPFSYQGQTLLVRLRLGDRLDPEQAAVDNAHTGPGRQGMDLRLNIAPRN